MKKIGGKYAQGPAWSEFVVSDERVITGQNPASAKAIGEEVLKHKW